MNSVFDISKYGKLKEKKEFRLEKEKLKISIVKKDRLKSRSKEKKMKFRERFPSFLYGKRLRSH